MGSSTAVGYGATSYALSWAGRLESSFNINTSDGIDTTFYNIAQGGYTTYHEMNTGCYVPPLRPSPDPLCNVTKALSYGPDVVIINLPSNDVGAGFSTTETMDNLRLMYNYITATGTKCYITTSQPRNDYTVLQRQELLDMKDSILAQFGLFAINFWDDLVTSDGLNMIRADRKDPLTDMHPNDLGHDFLFQRVQAKNIFGNIVLPLQLTAFTAQLNNNTTSIHWHTEQEEPNTKFSLERSSNGKLFTSLYLQTIKSAQVSAGYNWVDNTPLPGKSFYRLKVITPAHSFYSAIASVTNSSTLKISRLITFNNTATITADISNNKNEFAWISIVNSSGTIVKQTKQYLTAPTTRVSLTVPHFAVGKYYLKVTTNTACNAIKAFIK